MNPVQTWMGLRALQHGLAAAVGEAELRVRQLRELTGARSFDTELGSVSVTKRKPSVQLPREALLAWAKANHPDEVVVTESVRPSFEKAVLAACGIVDGEVVFTTTGDVLDWATVRPGGESLTARLSDEAKAAAEEQVVARLDEVAGLLQVEPGATQ